MARRSFGWLVFNSKCSSIRAAYYLRNLGALHPMQFDQKHYLVASTFLAGLGLSLIYFRGHIYLWLFPISPNFAEGIPLPTSVRFEGTLGRALILLTRDLSLLLLLTALAVVAREVVAWAVIGVVILCLLVRMAIAFRNTILRRPFLELTPNGLTYWPGFGRSVYWRWDEVRSIETRRGLIKADEERWKHTRRFTHLIVHHINSPANAVRLPIGLDFFCATPKNSHLVITLSIFGPPGLVAKTIENYRSQLQASRRRLARRGG